MIPTPQTIEPNQRYTIDRPLQFNTRDIWDLKGSTIVATRDFNVFEPAAPSTFMWRIQNGTIVAAGGNVIELAKGLTYNFELSNLWLRGGVHGVSLEQQRDAHAFLGNFKQIQVTDCEGFAFHIKGDPSGGHTNLRFEQCWSHNTTNSPQKGFYLYGIKGLTLDQCNADKLTNGTVFNIRNCQGSATNLNIEKQQVNSGNWHALQVSGGEMIVDRLTTFKNTINLYASNYASTVRATDGGRLYIHSISERELKVVDESGDNYYPALADRNGDTLLSNEHYAVQAEGSIKFNNGNWNEAQKQSTRIIRWNGEDK